MSPLHYPWWLVSRAAGITAYFLLSITLVLGLCFAMRVVPPNRRAELLVLHQRLALIALGTLALHGLVLLGDTWLHPALTQLLIPFTMSYRPLFTGLGTLAAYLAAVLALSFYLRRRVGPRRWRSAHRLIPLAWVLGSVHALGAGTDAGSLWLQIPLYWTMAVVVMLLLVRWTRDTQATPEPPAAGTPEPPHAPRQHPQPASLWAGSRE